GQGQEIGNSSVSGRGEAGATERARRGRPPRPSYERPPPPGPPEAAPYIPITNLAPSLLRCARARAQARPGRWGAAENRRPSGEAQAPQWQPSGPHDPGA